MAGKVNSKARLVKCPRCRQVLPEPPDVPVYTCGGCGTRLQAKKRNNSTVEIKSQRPDEDSSGKQKVDRVFVDQEAGCSSNQQSLLSSTDESDRKSDHSDLHSSSKDQDAAKRAENGTVDVPPRVVEECTSENLKTKKVSDNQQLVVSSSDEPDQNIHNDPRSSTEFSGHEDPQSSPEATAHNRIDQEHEQEQEQNRTYYQDAGKQKENITVVGLEHSSGKQKTGHLDANNESGNKFTQLLLVNPMNELDRNSDSNEHHSSSELSYHENPESSPEDAAHNRIDQQQEQEQNQSHYEDAGKQLENVTVVGLEHSSGKQKTKQLADDKETGNRFTQLLLVNPMNEVDRSSDRSEHRSSSELSYHDDQDSSPETAVLSSVKQHETEFLSCRKEAEIEESSSEFEETIANTRIISDSDKGSNSSFRSMIAEKLLDTRQKKPVYMDEDDLSEDGSANLRHHRRFGRISSIESMETTRRGGTSYHGYEGSVSSFDGNDDQIPIKNHIGSIRDEHLNSRNRFRFNRRNGYPLNGRIGKDEHRSTDVRSFHGLNEFHENLRDRPSMIPENPRMERIELLKLVRELQDQLERTNISNPQQVSSYYNHILNNPGRYGPRMAFSGEATAVNRWRDGSSCHHCGPQDRHFSAQLPSHHVCCSAPDYAPRSYRSPRFSGPSSPKYIHSESEFSAADDHWQQNEVMRPFHSPKKKRYVRPIAGGSPWITCYQCLKLLQLPQSFLLFNKRYHSLRCGACLKVLHFTLSDGTHVSRYHPEETIAAPPSSEAEDYDKLAGAWAGPVSCSDRSFEKSYSTETERNGSRSREFSEERGKATMSRDPSGSTRPPSSRISGRRTTTSEIEEIGPGPNSSPGSSRPPSSKVSGRRTTTSEIEEVGPGANGSPLHWLMGYASPSKVIRGL